MLTRKADDILSREITDENLYLNRRNFIRGAVLLATTSATGPLYRPLRPTAPEVTPDGAPSTEDVSQGARDLAGEKITPYEDITNYNNFYEFSTNKEAVAGRAKNFITRP